MSPLIRLLLVDDHAMFRDGLARTLAEQSDFHVVGECGSGLDALALLHQKPTIILLDVELGGGRALEVVQAIRKTPYAGHILIVTAGISGPEAVQLVHAGVAGIIHKQHSALELCETIRKIATGGVFLEPPYLSALMRAEDRTRSTGRPNLTDRERSVLRYLLQGMTNREIGNQLAASEAAIKASLRLLFEKLGVRTRSQLVKIILEKYRDQL